MTSDIFATGQPAQAVPLNLVSEAGLSAWLAKRPAHEADWLHGSGFAAERNRCVVIPGATGAIHSIVIGAGNSADINAVTIWDAAAWADKLPGVVVKIVGAMQPSTATRIALGFGLGRYRFTRYKKPSIATRATLVPPAGADMVYVARALQSMTLARDLINTPANDLGPVELEAATRQVAVAHGATLHVISDPGTLAAEYPLLAAVGAASARAPRLIDLRWGASDARRVTLVGKGVCFDTGGLDVKPSAGMALMKKDMGGAACALATADLLMASQTPIQLRLLIPAAENSLGGRAYRPGDVLRSRKGLSVEIGNTDAEGRLILADALCAADAERPDLLIDFATLTGAARTALGPELPAAYSNDEELLAQLRRCGSHEHDPIWPMPLWAEYDDDLSSRVADLNNVSAHSFAGSILAALFLQRFVTASPAWVHLDLYAWNAKDRPGRAVGAEAQCVRAVYQLIRQRFG